MKPTLRNPFRKPLIQSVVTAVASVLPMAGVHADTASITQAPVADSRVFNADWGWNTNNGSDGNIGIYQSRDRSLLQFMVPVGATINSANLTLTATETYGGNPGGESMDIYRLTGGWAESVVTWNNQPGYDNSTVHASSTANPGTGQTITWDVTSLANLWASGSVANNGLIIINNGNTNGLHFASKENSNVSYRPYLTTSFTTPTSVPAGAWSWGGGAGEWTGADEWLNGVTPATWTNNSDAVFGNGSDSAGEVAISGTVTPRTLWFRNTGSGNYAVIGGTIDFGGAMRIVDTAVDASISSAMTNGALFKQGAGKLSLTSTGMGGSPVNSFTGGTIISGGTLEIYGRSADNGGYTSLGTGPVTINNGGTLVSASDWTTGNEWNNGNVGRITINAGGTWTINGAGNTVRNGLVLNGATVNGSGSNGDWGGLYLRSTSVTVGGNAVSSISVDTAMYNAITMTVDSGSQLDYSGILHDRVSVTGGITKSGTGTLVLSGANSYSGVTDITAGTLVAAHNTALGVGGWSGSTMTWVRNGATLALQGGVSLGEHMHVIGGGVGGSGAIRSISGNNSLTMTSGNSGSGPGLAIDGDTTIGVDADTLTVTGFYHDSGSFGITKVGDGTLAFSSSSTYTGATLVSAGTLLVNGELGGTAVTVGPNGTIGGSGLLAGSLSFGDGAKLTVNLADPLTVNGAVTFASFGFDDLVNFNVQTVGEGTYTLLGGNNFNFANVSHFGLENAFVRNDGKLAYFQNGSLQVVVIPEPASALLGGLGVLVLLRRRR